MLQSLALMGVSVICSWFFGASSKKFSVLSKIIQDGGNVVFCYSKLIWRDTWNFHQILILEFSRTIFCMQIFNSLSLSSRFNTSITVWSIQWRCIHIGTRHLYSTAVIIFQCWKKNALHPVIIKIGVLCL